ncbi:MAG: hypothetical protein B7Y75_02575, partial [Azorhizobium sp. 35-67-5]
MLGAGGRDLVKPGLDGIVIVQREGRILAGLCPFAPEGGVGPGRGTSAQCHQLQRRGEPLIGRAAAIIIAVVEIRIETDRRRPGIQPSHQPAIGLPGAEIDG